MYITIMKGEPVHMTIPEPSDIAPRTPHTHLRLCLFSSKHFTMKRSASMMNRVMKLSPLYTAPAVLAMLPLLRLTSSIASSPSALLFEIAFAR